MDLNIPNTLLFYNPWIENPTLWADSVAKHLPEAFGYPYIRRFADEITNWPQLNKINLVVGPRQCGKSTLIWHTLSTLEPNIVYINANELVLRQWCTSPSGVMQDIQTIIEKPAALFFEEIQYVDNAGLFLKGIADLHSNIPVFATGSSSFQLHDMMRESLAGRAERIQLFPFSLNEWRKQGTKKKTGLPSKVSDQTLNNQLLQLLVFGSYPEVCFAPKPELVLNRLVEAFIIRDASDTFRIKYVAKFRKLMALMAVQIGNLANFSSWASDTGLGVKTLENYAHILEEAHIIRLLPPFVGGRRAEIKSAPKIFFIDNGIRNLLVNQFNDFEVRADKGALFENWLFSELLKHSNYNDILYYWRSKSGAEVDFVRQQGTRLQCFEAKAGKMKQPTLSRSARSFIAAYKPHIFYIVNMSLAAEDSLENTVVRWLTPLELMEVL